MGDQVISRVPSIAASARKLVVDNSLPLKVYYRTADNLLKQASVYRNEKSTIDLYVLLLRFSSLVSETIPEHRDYKKLFPKERAHYRKKLVEVIDELELLKPEIEKQLQQPNISSVESRSSNVEWPLNAERASAPNFGEQKDIDMPDSFNKQAHSSIGSLRIPYASNETLSRHSFFASLGKRSPNISHATPVQYPDFIEAAPVEISRSTQSLSLCIPSSSMGYSRNTFSPESLFASSQGPHSDFKPQGGLSSVDQLTDELPLWDPFNQPFPPPVAAPVQQVPASFDYFSDIATHSSGTMDRNTNFLFDDSSQTKAPKCLHVSLKMMEDFLEFAKPNTLRNLETCGVLSGYLEKGIFYITTLIIPKQESSSDSCQTLNEEEIFNIQDKRGLFQLGWIHTHPTQSCFMSSIDLHTHYSYQIMLQEAIAIVMAPTDTTREFGIFHLSDPGGLKVIQQCQQRGFHPHDEPPEGGPIYENCSHVFINPRLRFEVIDLR